MAISGAPQLALADDAATKFSITSVMLALTVHGYLTRRTLLPLQFRLGGEQKLATTRQKPDQDHAYGLGVERELDQVLVRSWSIACRYLVHLHLLPVLGSLYEIQHRYDTIGILWLFFVLLAYGIFAISACDFVEVTAARAKLLCGLMHGCVLGCLICSSWEDKEGYKTRRDALMLAQSILAILFPDQVLVCSWALVFVAASIATTVAACGVDSLSLWFFVQQFFQLVVGLLLPTVNERIHRERVKAFLQSQNADFVVSCFRRMLKGVCDGDLLLDSELHICGTPHCLHRLLGSQDDLSGKPFSQLILQEPDAVKTFEDFVAESAQAASLAQETAPRCFRVALKGRSRTVPVDVFHVSLPGSGTSPVYHLLALAEDADARLKAEAEAAGNFEPSVATASTETMAGSWRSESQCSEAVQVFDELSQLTFLVDASTELMDITEAYVKFARQTDAEKVGLGMPTLKKFVRPLDWPAVRAKIHKVARAVGAGKVRKSHALPPMIIRIPGQARSYLRARDVAAKSVYIGPRPAGQPAYLHLTMSKFDSPSTRPTQNQPMAGVNEDPEQEQRAASDGSLNEAEASSS